MYYIVYFINILFIKYYILYMIYYLLYFIFIYCILYICILYIIYYIFYIVYYILDTIYYILYVVYYILYIIYSLHYTLYLLSALWQDFLIPLEARPWAFAAVLEEFRRYGHIEWGLHWDILDYLGVWQEDDKFGCTWTRGFIIPNLFAIFNLGKWWFRPYLGWPRCV